CSRLTRRRVERLASSAPLRATRYSQAVGSSGGEAVASLQNESCTTSSGQSHDCRANSTRAAAWSAIRTASTRGVISAVRRCPGWFFPRMDEFIWLSDRCQKPSELDGGDLLTPDGFFCSSPSLTRLNPGA